MKEFMDVVKEVEEISGKKFVALESYELSAEECFTEEELERYNITDLDLMLKTYTGDNHDGNSINVVCNEDLDVIAIILVNDDNGDRTILK